MANTTAPVARDSRTDEPVFRRRRLSTAEFHHLAEAGILSTKDRVELVQGELMEMAPVGSRHAYIVNLLNERLTKAAPEGIRAWCQSPVRFAPHSELRPDLALIIDANYRDRLPGPEDVRLIIEVADAGLRYDREFKLPFYARHGIPELWLLDLTVGSVEVCRQPDGDTYRLNLRPRLDDTLAPEGMPEASLKPFELFT